jgi:hypothetical protein
MIFSVVYVTIFLVDNRDKQSRRTDEPESFPLRPEKQEYKPGTDTRYFCSQSTVKELHNSPKFDDKKACHVSKLSDFTVEIFNQSNCASIIKH